MPRTLAPRCEQTGHASVTRGRPIGNTAWRTWQGQPRRRDLAVHSTPRFLQGVYSFEGKGLDRPFLIDPALTYTVPGGSVTQPVYFRGGNASGELICVYLMRDGQPMRYFPIGARNHT